MVVELDKPVIRRLRVRNGVAEWEIREQGSSLLGAPFERNDTFIWPYDGNFLVGSQRHAKQYPHRLIMCHYTFPTEDAAIMFVLTTN